MEHIIRQQHKKYLDRYIKKLRKYGDSHIIELDGVVMFDHEKGIGWLSFRGELWRYYSEFIYKETKLRLSKPRLGAHATFMNKKFDQFASHKVKQKSRSIRGSVLTVSVDLGKMQLNRSRKGDFYGLYVSLDDRPFDKIRHDLGITGSHQPHITIATTKSHARQ